MAVLDRSWYGRVLVERVEQLTPELHWRRAYDEIDQFERSLHDEGMVLVKLWLHVSSREQLKRFRERERDPLKRWKLTDDDWRNRKQRRAYVAALEDMFEGTDKPFAPWHLISAESKHYARVAVLDCVIEAIEAGMRRHGMQPVKEAA
jgi:polyphosphate kinase 2 (PPK2 family)